MEKLTSPASEKLDETNPEDSTESAEEKSTKHQRIVPVIHVIVPAGERHSGTEADTTLGQNSVLGALTAKPITTVPPTLELKGINQ